MHGRSCSCDGRRDRILNTRCGRGKGINARLWTSLRRLSPVEESTDAFLRIAHFSARIRILSVHQTGDTVDGAFAVRSSRRPRRINMPTRYTSVAAK